MRLKNKLLLAIVTFGYSGLISKKMPGTVGSIVAMLISYFIPSYSIIFFFITIVFFILGLVTCQEYIERNKENKDPGFIVIDEAVAIFFANAIVLSFTKYNDIIYIMNLILFRLFDIYKPWPINKIEQYFMNKPKLYGFGIMIDDIIAAVPTAILNIALFK